MLTFQTQQETIDKDQAALLVSVNGTFDRVSVKHCENQFEDYIKIGYRFIILDCAGIKFINSSGLQLMLKLVEDYRDKGGILLFIHVLPQISKFFDMLGFTPILTAFNTKEEAIEYLNVQIKKGILGEKKTDTVALTKASVLPPTKKNVPIVPNLAQQSPTQRPFVATRKLTLQNALQQNPYESAKPSSSLPVSNPVPQPLVSSSKKVPVNIPTSLEIEIAIDYYKKMLPWRAFPLKIQFLEVKSMRAKEQNLYIMPYFPGCFAVPAYRSMITKEGNQCTFWITPQTSYRIQPWLEMGRSQDQAQVFEIDVRMGSFRLAKTFFFLALAVSGLHFFTPWFSAPKALDSFLSQIPAHSFIMPYLGYILAGFLFFLSFIFYLKNKPRQAKTLKKTIQLESMESGFVNS